jgi:hypothetical protein
LRLEKEFVALGLSAPGDSSRVERLLKLSAGECIGFVNQFNIFVAENLVEL